MPVLDEIRQFWDDEAAERHLVWTLPDSLAALRAWRAVGASGGWLP
jgi:hypothetical protein